MSKSDKCKALASALRGRGFAAYANKDSVFVDGVPTLLDMSIARELNTLRERGVVDNFDLIFAPFNFSAEVTVQ